MANTLSERIDFRIDRPTKARLAVEAARQQRSEGAIVRLALHDYLSKRKGQK